LLSAFKSAYQSKRNLGKRRRYGGKSFGLLGILLGIGWAPKKDRKGNPSAGSPIVQQTKKNWTSCKNIRKTVLKRGGKRHFQVESFGGDKVELGERFQVFKGVSRRGCEFL